MSTSLDLFSVLFGEVEKDPSDWVARSILSDWLGENEREEMAECVRWTAVNRKRPYVPNITGEGKGKATWFNSKTVEPGLGDTESDLPEELYRALSGGDEQANHKTFPSFKDAEMALWNAWRETKYGKRGS